MKMKEFRQKRNLNGVDAVAGEELLAGDSDLLAILEEEGVVAECR